MELKIEHEGGDKFTIQDQHGCYLDEDGDQIVGMAYLTTVQVLAVVKRHCEAQTA